MKKILLIGNSGLKHHGVDGQTAKVRIYLKKIKEEGFDCKFIDLEDFIKHPFSKLLKIKKSIKTCDRIVLLSAKRGCRILIPYINSINKKYKKPFVLPLIGTSVLHYSIDGLSDAEKYDFLFNGNFDLCKKDIKISKHLKKIDYILPETDLITDVFRNFYNLNNVFTLNNFRDAIIFNRTDKNSDDALKLVFLSRIMKQKGVFDLLDVVNEINSTNNIYLDIYGKKVLNHEEDARFNSLLNNKVRYCGTVNFEDVIQTLSKYDLFVFPTRFVGEGTPGVIAESLIAGTPVLTSNFPQANRILNNDVDSLFYKMFDKDDLKNKIFFLLNNKNKLNALKEGAKFSGSSYLYEKERQRFLKYVCGIDL